jgi:hypothetical protein
MFIVIVTVLAMVNSFPYMAWCTDDGMFKPKRVRVKELFALKSGEKVDITLKV